jgi:hypothetical protein
MIKRVSVSNDLTGIWYCASDLCDVERDIPFLGFARQKIVGHVESYD